MFIFLSFKFYFMFFQLESISYLLLNHLVKNIITLQFIVELYCSLLIFQPKIMNARSDIF